MPEDTLLAVTAEVLGTPEFDKEEFAKRVSSVLVCNGNKLVYRLGDGTEREIIWKDRSRSQSWTPEMKEKARQKALARKGDKAWQK